MSDYGTNNIELMRQEVDSFEVQKNRSIQEVQGQIIMAKKFPRNEARALEKILSSCKRKKLAEESQYTFPRSGKSITGASIRLAEVIAQYWGNLSFGVHELDQSNGESIMEAFCWDLETNVRQSKVFKVKHERVAQGKINKLKDPRDIYELTANYGSRRLRACILGVIPQDIFEEAIEECNRTLSGNNNEPIEDRLRRMVSAFNNIGVRSELIETMKSKELKFFTTDDIGEMIKIYNSIKDGITKISDWFQAKEKTISENTQKIAQDLSQISKTAPITQGEDSVEKPKEKKTPSFKL